MAKTLETRVISGAIKGTKLSLPASSDTHPMGSREKLALFNMIDVGGGKVLDAYAGSGALGIEALSRGASSVTFVENSPAALTVLRQNLTEAGKNPIGQKLKFQVFGKSVASFSAATDFLGYFDVIIADPPYDRLSTEELSGLIKLLRTGGIFVLSSPASAPAPDLPGVELISTRTYAGARISVYGRPAA